GFSTAVWRLAVARGLPIAHYLHDFYLTCHRSVRLRNGVSCRQSCPACACLTLRRRDAARLVHSVIGNSDFALGEHRRLGLFGGAATFVAPPYAHAHGLEMASRQRAAVLTLGYLGRLSPEKGVAELVAAWRRMRVKTRLLIGGPIATAGLD